MTIRGKAQGFSATFKPTSNEEPCQICGNTDGDCRTTSGSELILCMKQDHDVNGFKAIGKTKDDLWTEYLPEGAKRAKREQEPKPQAKPKEQIPDDRKDSYYQALFHQLTLSPNHREDLQRRGLSDDQIETLGARSLSSGYLVPFQDETGRYVGAQVRRDNPGDGTRYFWHSEQSNHAKHNDRGELPLAIFARAGNTALIVEGTGVKPFLAGELLGLIAIGAAGGLFHSSPKTFSAAVNALGIRTVLVAPDAGDVINDKVIPRLKKNEKLFRSLGLEVIYLWWNQKTKDDNDIDELTSGNGIERLTPQKFWDMVKPPKKPVIQEEKRAPADQLIDLVQEHPGVTFWHTPDQQAYIDVIEGDIRETLPLRRKAFKQWITRAFYLETRRSPASDALHQAINTLESIAIYDGKEYEAHLRVAEHEGNIYIDLGTPTWEAVKISPDGWEVVKDAPVRFRRVQSMLPMPIPQRGGSLHDFQAFFNLEERSWSMVTTWLINCFKPASSYPILILHGEQGSGKSTISEALKRLTDPSQSIYIKLTDDRNFSISANNRWLMVYDNLSGISAEYSDSLCRVATGSGFTHRELHTDLDETCLQFTRPQLINGIDSVATRSDLLDRSILVTVPKPKKQRDLKTFWQDFDNAHPKIFGAICDAISVGLKNLPQTTVENLPRMADYALFATALEPALNLNPGQFMDHYRRIKDECHETAIESSPLAQAILTLMDDRTEWSGTPTELLTALNNRADEYTRKQRSWPKRSNDLGKALIRIAPDLRATGVDYQFTRPGGKKRFLSLQNTKLSSLSSLSSSSLRGKPSGYDDNKNLSSYPPNLSSYPTKTRYDDKKDDDDNRSLEPDLLSSPETLSQQHLQPSYDSYDDYDDKIRAFSPGEKCRYCGKSGKDVDGKLIGLESEIATFTVLEIQGDTAIVRVPRGNKLQIHLSDLRRVDHAK